VSLAAASRAISNSSYGVTKGLQERVLAAAEDLDYVPNAHAQALVRSRMSALGVIVQDVSDPYFSEVVRGIHGVADETHRLVTICTIRTEIWSASWPISGYCEPRK
jgi:LacI family transcriptional regulator